MNAKSATFALQISFLLGMQLILGQEPPIHRRSTTAVRLPALPHMPGQVLTALATAEDVAGLSGYPSIAVLSINPRIDAMGHKRTHALQQI